MITFKQFLNEGHGFTATQEFMIRSWGKILYLDYFALPSGPDMSNHPEFKAIVKEYLANLDDDDRMQELDEWINEGGPLKDGTKLVSRKTVDAVLQSCARPAGKEMVLNRFDHTPSTLKPNAWISLTKMESGYEGTKRSFTIGPDDLIIETHGLADKDEVIVNTNELTK